MEPITIALALAKATGLTDLIGRKLGGSKGADIASKVMDAAEIVTGTKDPKAALEAMRQNTELVQALRLRLIDMYEADAQREANDRANARATQVAIATSESAPHLVKLLPSILALVVVIGSLALFVTLMFADVQPENKDVVVYVMGALNSAMTMILGYHFGSSVGSKSKDEMLSAIAKQSG